MNSSACYQQNPVAALGSSQPETWLNSEQIEMYLALLGLAESLSRQGEPEGVFKCLAGIIALKVPFTVSARIYCEMGKLLLRQSEEYDMAKQHLDQAAMAGSALEDTKLDAASALADLYIAQDNVAQARDILHSAIEQSQHSPYWQCNFIFQLSKVFMLCQDFVVATQILTLGESFSLRHDAQYLTLLFQLTRVLVQLRAKQHSAALVALHDVQVNLDNISAGILPLLREELRFYLIALEALCRLNFGQAKSVRLHIQNLQTCLDKLNHLRASNVSANSSQVNNPLDMFAFTCPELFPVLSHAVSAQFFGLIGYHDRLDRIYSRSMTYLSELEGLGDATLQAEFRCTIYQMVIPSTLTTNRLNKALEEVSAFLSLWFCKSSEMMNFINLNQAMVYLRQQRFQEFGAIVQRTGADQGNAEHIGLQCGTVILQGLTSLLERRSDVAKVLFRNGLQISNDEDRNQLMAVSLLLMSRNCTAMGDYQDVVKVARTALDLAEKIPDHGLQCAALHILSDVYSMMGDYAGHTNAVNARNILSNRESQELNVVRRNSKLASLQWTDG